MNQTTQVGLRINGVDSIMEVPDRLTLADALRDRVGLTGTKLGCEQGVCGACTVLLDGVSTRSCLVLSPQADGADVVTVEGLPAASRAGRALQEAFERHDALQCGFCTPGFLVAATELLAEEHLDEESVRVALTGNICRCTGYGGIVAAVLEVHRALGPVPLAGHDDRRDPLLRPEPDAEAAAPAKPAAEAPARPGAATVADVAAVPRSHVGRYAAGAGALLLLGWWLRRSGRGTARPSSAPAILPLNVPGPPTGGLLGLVVTTTRTRAR